MINADSTLRLADLAIGWNRCDVCGRYISMSDFDSGAAKRVMVTPDSEYTTEDFSTLCKTHKP